MPRSLKATRRALLRDIVELSSPRTVATFRRLPAWRVANVETGALDQAKQTLAMIPEAKQIDAAGRRGARGA